MVHGTCLIVENCRKIHSEVAPSFPAGNSQVCIEYPPDLPLPALLVAEDGMADHQVAEGGDADRNESVPGN